MFDMKIVRWGGRVKGGEGRKVSCRSGAEKVQGLRAESGTEGRVLSGSPKKYMPTSPLLKEAA